MEIKILNRQGNRYTVVCGCGKIREVLINNLGRLQRQKTCRCKQEKKFTEKVPQVVIHHQTNAKASLMQMGFKPVRFKLQKPIQNADYTLRLCTDGRLVFENCQHIIGAFGNVWVDKDRKRIALQSSPTGDVKFRNNNFSCKRNEFEWAIPQKTSLVKGRYIPSVQAVVFQL